MQQLRPPKKLKKQLNLATLKVALRPSGVLLVLFIFVIISKQRNIMYVILLSHIVSKTGTEWFQRHCEALQRGRNGDCEVVDSKV